MDKVIIKNRIWEIDAIRGFAFLLMVFDHLSYDLGNIFLTIWKDQLANEHFLLKIAEFAHMYRRMEVATWIRFIFISGVFLFISGISSVLTKNNFKRGLKLFIISIGLSLITLFIALITKSYAIIIYFGILHCLSVSMMLTPLFKKLNRYVLLPLGFIIIGVGSYLQGNNFTGHFLLIPFNIYPASFVTADYYPLLPFMGIYIIGIVIGSLLYKEKKSLFKKDRNIPLLNFFGRNALWLYFVHQVLLFVLLYLIGLIFINFF